MSIIFSQSFSSSYHVSHLFSIHLFLALFLPHLTAIILSTISLNFWLFLSPLFYILLLQFLQLFFFFFLLFFSPPSFLSHLTVTFLPIIFPPSFYCSSPHLFSYKFGITSSTPLSSIQSMFCLKKKKGDYPSSFF
jgi:hypothetical protein